jgi:hypothetical protein
MRPPRCSSDKELFNPPSNALHPCPQTLFESSKSPDCRAPNRTSFEPGVARGAVRISPINPRRITVHRDGITLAPNDDRLFVDRDTELPETACRGVAYRFWDLVESIGAAHRGSELSGGNVRGHTIENVRHLHRHYRSRLDALVAQLVGADPEGWMRTCRSAGQARPVVDRLLRGARRRRLLCLLRQIYPYRLARICRGRDKSEKGEKWVEASIRTRMPSREDGRLESGA